MASRHARLLSAFGNGPVKARGRFFAPDFRINYPHGACKGSAAVVYQLLFQKKYGNGRADIEAILLNPFCPIIGACIYFIWKSNSLSLDKARGACNQGIISLICFMGIGP